MADGQPVLPTHVSWWRLRRWHQSIGSLDGLERPHQAPGGSYPGDLYAPSARTYAPPPEPEYPYYDKTIRVTHCGRICMGRRTINLRRVFAGQLAGLREVNDQIWPVTFLDFDLGLFDRNNPLRIRSHRRKCQRCLRKNL